MNIQFARNYASATSPLGTASSTSKAGSSAAASESPTTPKLSQAGFVTDLGVKIQVSSTDGRMHLMNTNQSKLQLDAARWDTQAAGSLSSKPAPMQATTAQAGMPSFASATSSYDATGSRGGSSKPGWGEINCWQPSKPTLQTPKQAQVTEGGDLIWKVRLDKPTSTDARVGFVTHPGEAENWGKDFDGRNMQYSVDGGKSWKPITISGTEPWYGTIPAGGREIMFKMPTTDDKVSEGLEKFPIEFKANSSNIRGDVWSQGTIIDNDKPQPTPKKAWVIDNAGNVGKVNPQTGELTTIGNAGKQLTDIAQGPDGKLYGMDFNNLYEIDQQSGKAKLIGAHCVPGGNALEVGDNGQIYAMGANSNKLYQLDMETIFRAQVGDPNPNAPTHFIFPKVLADVGDASMGDLIYQNGKLWVSGQQGIRSVDPASGQVSSNSPVVFDGGPSTRIFGLMEDPNNAGFFIGAGEDGKLYRLVAASDGKFHAQLLNDPSYGSFWGADNER